MVLMGLSIWAVVMGLIRGFLVRYYGGDDRAG